MEVFPFTSNWWGVCMRKQRIVESDKMKMLSFWWIEKPDPENWNYFIHNVYIKMKMCPFARQCHFQFMPLTSAMQGSVNREIVLWLIASPLGQLFQYGIFPSLVIICKYKRHILSKRCKNGSEEELSCALQFRVELKLTVAFFSFFFLTRMISREALNFLTVNSHTLLGLISRSWKDSLYLLSLDRLWHLLEVVAVVRAPVSNFWSGSMTLRKEVW